MPASCPRLFLPGWAAAARMYELPAGWIRLEPPTFRATRGVLGPYVEWTLEELRRRDEAVVLAGHSMGGALALLAAAAEPERVARLVLVSPAGLPLRKPIHASLRDCMSQAAAGVLPPGSAPAAARLLAAPLSALRLARTLRALDLSKEMRRVREAGVPGRSSPARATRS